jgi:hypothetical protein
VHLHNNLVLEGHDCDISTWSRPGPSSALSVQSATTTKMSLDTASFFESPRRQAADKDVGPGIDVDAFFGERLALDDALTDATSPNTGATTPARSDGWIVEDDEAGKSLYNIIDTLTYPIRSGKRRSIRVFAALIPSRGRRSTIASNHGI